MRTGFKLVLAAGTLLAMMGAANADPSISLDKVVVKGATISGRGQYDTDGKTFKSITLFAVPKSGGVAVAKTITTPPSGAKGPWGALDVTTKYQSKYQVWAVLVVTDAGGTDSYYGSAVSEPPVNQGTTPVPTSNIVWSDLQQPTSDGATISGAGTWTQVAGSTQDVFAMWIWPAAGGAMGKCDVTLADGNPRPWSASGTGVVGVSTNVSPISTATVPGLDQPVISTAPIRPITP